jgi:hypothetical protein
MKSIGRGRHHLLVLALLAGTLVLAGCSPSGKVPANSRVETAAGLTFAVPQDWTSSEPSTTMRAAQFTMPAEAGGDVPELVVFFFGEGKGGDAESNIQRWIGMVGGPEGMPAAEKAKRESRKVGDFKVSIVTVDGSYDAFVGMGMSGGMSGPHGSTAKADYRLWGAVVEGPGGPWFFKATGPQAALAKAEPALKAMIGSVKKATV